MTDTARIRLDLALVARGIVASRSRARDLIGRGFVNLNGNTVSKAAALVAPNDELVLSTDAPEYVSRGGEKLAAALDTFAISPANGTILDIGASTGGFTDVLLRRGARKVFAVDVGHDQLARGLREHPAVVNLEGTDARRLTEHVIGSPVDGIVLDVSFISLLKVLPNVLSLAAAECWAVALIKPQFEVGPDYIGKGGLVTDKAARDRAVTGIEEWLESQQGWNVDGVVPSPILGGSGNKEYLIGARRRSATLK